MSWRSDWDAIPIRSYRLRDPCLLLRLDLVLLVIRGLHDLSSPVSMPVRKPRFGADDLSRCLWRRLGLEARVCRRG
jgi:hypothetical protein